MFTRNEKDSEGQKMGAICIESEQQGRTRLVVHGFAKKAIENIFLIESHEARKKMIILRQSETL